VKNRLLTRQRTYLSCGTFAVLQEAHLCQRFPLASFKHHDKSGSIDILIAGCGTGQHPIQTAQQFQGAQVLAVDLSMSSLSYAKRKTRELGLTSIEYAQADLLKLGSLGRSFDVIESAGVLHHLTDPWAGWQVLLSLLRPHGFMKLGFYSDVARRNVVRIRSFIAEQGYGTQANEIRRCRQDLVNLDQRADFGITLKSPDFFSTSTCRDLLFHVQEHRLTLTGIDAFLRENNLLFLGFEIDAEVLQVYKRRFPEDRAATNLGQWQVFENENPDTFFSMYQFWIQKAG
jgi:SAM-dependent methyltransferase